MNDLSERQKLNNQYVKKQTDKIKAKVIKDGYAKVSTYDDSNWDNKLHLFMPRIAAYLRSKGITVNMKVNYRVCDWSFML